MQGTLVTDRIAEIRAKLGSVNVETLPAEDLEYASDLDYLLAQLDKHKTELIAMVYVHPCGCKDGIPAGQCARCRSVKLLGFDPVLV
jgi:uncharacterized protein YfkK (UPF0435 family)